MNRDELLFDKIEAYLRGQMPPADAAAFETEIAADPELAGLVKTHRLERQGLEWLVERDLLAKMNAWEREANSGGTTQSRATTTPERDGTILNRPVPAPSLRISFVRRWRWAAGVAATLVLGAFGWWLIQPQEDIGGPPPVATVPKVKPPVTAPNKATPNPSKKPQSQPKEEDDRVVVTPKPAPGSSAPAPTIKPPAPATVDYGALAANYYRKDDFMQEAKGATGGGNESSGYGSALDSYKSGKYADVEKLLKPALQKDPNALKTKELLAHSLYQRGQYAEALTYFRQLTGARDKALAERSEWAMALTLLHQMPAQKALLVRALDRIVSKPGHAFYGKAKELRGKVVN